MSARDIYGFIEKLRTEDVIERTIYVDVHEPPAMFEILTEVANNYDMKVKVKVLEVGDYVFGNVGIERKELDFIKIPDVLAKADELRRSYKQPFVLTSIGLDKLIEEDINRHGGKWSESLKGLTASLVARGVPPIFCPDKRTMCEVMCKMFDKLTDGKDRNIEQPLRPQPTHKDWQIYILSSLPHIGEVTAMKLLSHFKTVKSVMNATSEELMEVDGVGKKIVNDILNVLNNEKEIEE